jgi:glutamate--cysteine ligase
MTGEETETDMRAGPNDLTGAVDRAFTPGAGTRRLGAEVELFALGPPSAPIPPIASRGLPAGAVLSREPGGQVEVSLAPRPTPELLAADVATAVGVVGRQAPVHLVGTHPTAGLAEVPLLLSTPRYRAMQRLFDRTGPDGRRMMRLTASLQVCVDRLPGAEGDDQWLVANLAGPALAATYANSPLLDGRPTGRPGNRTAIWRAMDPTRTGYDGRHLDPVDPRAGYLAFARAAPRLRTIEARDHTYHLGTLFPPVRPRAGYLELRFLDAQPLDRIPSVLSTIATLLFDADARRAALDLLLPTLPYLGQRWDLAARGSSPEAADLLVLGHPVQASA